MKDVKSLLKNAREAIKNKRYEDSLKLCKEILEEDNNNYMALVLLAVSLQETGQTSLALKAFHDAIHSNPSNVLAWNGMINYYEKFGTKEMKNDMIKAYISLLNIEPNEQKLIDYTKKLCNLSEGGSASEIVPAIYSLLKSGKCNNTVDLAIALANILSKEKNIPPELLFIYEEALTVVINDEKTISVKYYSDYLNVLYKLNKTDELLIHAKKLHVMCQPNSTSLKWICKIFNEYYIGQGIMIEKIEDIALYNEELLNLEDNSVIGMVTKSILLIEDKKLIEAKELLNKIIALQCESVQVWILLLKCYTGLHLVDDAVEVANKAEKLLRSDQKLAIKLKNVLDILLVNILSQSSEEHNLKQALEIYEMGNEELKRSCVYYVIRANINLKNYTKAASMLADLQKSCDSDVMCILLSAQMLYNQGNYGRALEVLKNRDIEMWEWWIQIGLIHWHSGEFDKSLMPFLKATKLDPTNYKCFLLLGNYYKKINDLDKARRCYEKSFKINRRSSEAGIELSEIYRKTKNWEANLVLLQNLTRQVIHKQNSWAWMQLGLHYLEQQDFEKAVTNLRTVIRVDGNNMNCWESLADAYLAKGAYTSALKCYEKASSFSQNALYPLLQMATIKQILGEFAEAKLDFQSILSISNLYVPALKGMAETSMLQAKECFKEHRLGTCRSHLQNAVDNLIIAVQQRNDLSCLWKLIADSCLLITKLSEQYCCLLIPIAFVEENENCGNTVLEKNDLFILAEKCYYKSLSLKDDNVLIWHDLAVCLLTHARSSEDTVSLEQLIHKAQVIAQYCSLKNPTYWQHWNLLGNVAMHSTSPNYKLAQHSFIKAVHADNNSAVAWSNLGTLYMILEDYRLANEAYSQAQRADPNYVNSWIGQALLAENLAHEDAMDLFRHSTQLAIHEQGALGYAHWVCKTLKQSELDAVIYSVHNMHAIPVACDAITWYIEENATDGTAWNMVGILKERMGLKLGALNAFKNALNFSTGKNRDLARVNYGRLLLSINKYSTAVATYKDVKEATFNSASGLALALFKEKCYKESYETYESTLHWLSEEPQIQSELLVALASMAYMFDGPEAAKTLLFQSIQLEKPSPWGYFAVLALSLINGDFNLAKLVINEMDELKNRGDCIQHFATLVNYFYLMQNNNKASIREISKIIHRYPDQGTVWLILSTILIRSYKNKTSAATAAKCAQSAMKLGRANMDVTKVLCVAALSFFVVDDIENALVMAQKAVHCYPTLPEAWTILAVTLLKAKKVNTVHAKRIFKFSESLCTCNQLKNWIGKVISSL